LLSRFTFNGSFIDTSKTIKDFFFINNYGFNKVITQHFIRRFECWNTESLSNIQKKTPLTFLHLLHKLIPRKANNKNQVLLNIIFLDLAYSYQGWRHFTGLPVHGQRTWSNAWSTFKSNNKLRDYKYKLAKNNYGRSQNIDIKVYMMAEHVNYLWRNQYYTEWSFGREWLRRLLKKNPYNFKIDFVAIARGLLGNTRKESSKVGKKKKKLLTGYVGFDTGFTKIYFKYKQRLTKQKKKRIK
jgi:ribosomal protein S13